MSTQKHHLDQLRIDRTSGGKRSSGALLLWGGVFVLVIAVVAGAFFLTRPKAIAVTTSVARESVSGERSTVLNASGYVTARREATVSSKVTGKVVEILIEEGMAVKEGQILARLDSANVTANFRLAEAQLAASKAVLSESRIRSEEAQLNWNRIAALVKDRIASQADFDQADAELKALEARLERETIEVTVAERQVALWQQQLDDNVIMAPFAGVVVSKNAQPGEMISPISAGGGFTRTGICTIVDMDSLEIEVDVSESYINRVTAGQSVVAVLDSYPEWRIPSHVIAIIPTADRQKATVKVRVGFEALDSRILPQMGVKVSFQDSVAAGAARRKIVIPTAAVRQVEGRDVVMTVKDRRAERRAVTLGDSGVDEVEVLAGLSAGEAVILRPPAELKDGGPVKETER